MTKKQVYDFFIYKKDTPCKLTEELIKSGYQQASGGYIKKAKEEGIIVDYKIAEPTQWWHLIESYCEDVESNPNAKFTRRIRCGELYFWMAEVSGCFTRRELETLLDEAMRMAEKVDHKNKLIPPLKTAKSNTYIRDYCFERIMECVEKYNKSKL